jgi:hypothetical protein
MRGRRAIEQQRENAIRIGDVGDQVKLVDCPALSDVVFKAGTSNLSHRGNSIFHEMLRNQSDELQSANKRRIGVMLDSTKRPNCWSLCLDTVPTMPGALS